MSDLATSSLDAGLWKAIEDYIAGSTNSIRNEWLRREQSIKARLETIRREREAVEADIQSMEDRTKKTFDYFLGNLPEQRFRPMWEAQGELVPSSIRGLLGELRGPSHRLLSPALSSAGNDTHQQSSSSPFAGDATEQDVTISVHASEMSGKQYSSTKRSAEATDGSSDTTVNKRQRVSNSDYTFRASEEAIPPQSQRFQGTVQFYEIEGLHWVFRSPITGPGYYVLLCDENEKEAHPFKDDPWVRQRARKHYTKKHDCHDFFFDLTLSEVSELMIMQRFGYLVEDMTEEDCRSSNQLLVDSRQQPKKQKSKSHQKMPPTHTTHHNPLGGPAAVADMGSYANYHSPTVEDYIPNVRSDL